MCRAIDRASYEREPRCAVGIRRRTVCDTMRCDGNQMALGRVGKSNATQDQVKHESVMKECLGSYSRMRVWTNGDGPSRGAIRYWKRRNPMPRVLPGQTGTGDLGEGLLQERPTAQN